MIRICLLVHKIKYIYPTMIKFYFFLILLMQSYSNAYAVDQAKSNNENSKKIHYTGEEIIQRLDKSDLFSIVEDNIWNNKAVLDPTKKYTINLLNDLCPHQWSSTDEIEDCDEKTKICKCQNQESKNENNTKLGTLIKYYKNDQLHCFQSSGNHQSCFLFQDEDGKFAYIIPSKYNLKPTNDLADLQKEFFFTMMEAGSSSEIYFSDEEGICKNAKEKFDKKTKETYLDCTTEQGK